MITTKEVASYHDLGMIAHEGQPTLFRVGRVHRTLSAEVLADGAWGDPNGELQMQLVGDAFLPVEVIGRWLEARSSVSICEALAKCLQKAQALWTQTDKNRAARCLKALGWERYRERQGGRLEWRYQKEK